jgi:16S rRNA (cytidine1402-2'-O)-methyltransferase
MLGDSVPEFAFPPANNKVIENTKVFITENIKTTRRFLKRINKNIDIDTLVFHILDKHTKPEETITYLDEAKRGMDTGLLSEAGTPCVADPGAIIVKHAHMSGIVVVPLIGPNSILLALMASGFNGQNFRFHGYLPIASKERIAKIRELEREVLESGQTQIFIETPYRNMALYEALLKGCQDGTALCIASNLTTQEEFIRTKTIGEWRKEKTDLHKKPAVFLLNRS